MSNVILYYNKDLFDKAGVAYPTNDWTWNDMLAAAKKLTLDTNKDGKIDQWGFAVNNIVWVWAGFVWGNGGDILSPDRKSACCTIPRNHRGAELLLRAANQGERLAARPGALPRAELGRRLDAHAGCRHGPVRSLVAPEPGDHGQAVPVGCRVPTQVTEDRQAGLGGLHRHVGHVSHHEDPETDLGAS